MECYICKKLSGIINGFKKDPSARSAGAKESLIVVAAGYATDFIDLAKDNKVRLDLSSGTEENVPRAMTLTHFYNVKRGLNEKECRTDLTKRLDAYELFTIYNGLVSAGDANVQIDVVLGDLIVKTKGAGGRTISFNVYEKVRTVLKDFQLTAKGEDSVLFGTMQPFYQALMTEFIEKL